LNYTISFPQNVYNIQTTSAPSGGVYAGTTLGSNLTPTTIQTGMFSYTSQLDTLCDPTVWGKTGSAYTALDFVACTDSPSMSSAFFRVYKTSTQRNVTFNKYGVIQGFTQT